MSFFQAVRLAWETIRVQKLKSFFTVIGVTIGVTFLIAVVSIVSGMGRYMKDDLIGKLIAVNSFNLRQRPDIQLGDVTQDDLREWRKRPHIMDSDVPAVAAALAPDVLACCVAGHRSHEPGATAALDHLGLAPLLDLGMRLGEGSGACLALPVVEAAARLLREMATFDSAGVSEK